MFPLPVIPFEEYMLLDDRPDYPAAGFMQLVFQGRFEPDALQSAFETALARHPLLSASIRTGAGGRLEWIAGPGAEAKVHWIPPGMPLALDVPWYMDLRREIGMRVFMREVGDRTEMFTQNHHACCDGLGVLNFLSDFLGAYHRLRTPDAEAPPLVSLDPERLRERGRFGMTWASWLARLPKDLVASLASIEFLAHRPIPVAPPRESGENCQPPGGSLVPAVAGLTLSEEETQQVRKASRELGCTMNDLLLGAVFLTVARWNRTLKPGNEKGVLRVMIPTSLRSAEDVATPAANIVSMVYLDRRLHRYATPRQLLRSVRWEMTICKKWRLGLTMIQFMRLFSHLPGGLGSMLPGDRCLSTSVLSNVGDLTRCLALPVRDGRIVVGDTVLERYDVLPPVRPLTSASFGANSYNGRMCLAIHCDPYSFTPADAQNLLEAYARQVVAVAQRPDEPWAEVTP